MCNIILRLKKSHCYNRAVKPLILRNIITFSVLPVYFRMSDYYLPYIFCPLALKRVISSIAIEWGARSQPESQFPMYIPKSRIIINLIITVFLSFFPSSLDDIDEFCIWQKPKHVFIICPNGLINIGKWNRHTNRKRETIRLIAELKKKLPQ